MLAGRLNIHREADQSGIDSSPELDADKQICRVNCGRGCVEVQENRARKRKRCQRISSTATQRCLEQWLSPGGVSGPSCFSLKSPPNLFHRNINTDPLSIMTAKQNIEKIPLYPAKSITNISSMLTKPRPNQNGSVTQKWVSAHQLRNTVVWVS